MSPMMGHCNAGYGAPPMAYGYNAAPPIAYGYNAAPPMAYGYNAPPPAAYGYTYARPQPMMAAGASYGPPPPEMALPMAPSMNFSAQPPAVQPCGYSPNVAPSYWYGR